MSESPLLSICIPAYNRPLWFKRALESIVTCNVQFKIEIIITDDSNNQDCEEIARRILKGWRGKWYYEYHEIRFGMAQNWNQGVNLATGRYVTILHDDDFYVAQGVEDLTATLNRLEDQYSVMLFGVLVVNEQEQIIKRQIFKQDQFLSSKKALINLFSNSSFVRFPGIVVRRSLFQELGFFNPKWKEPCDIEMWMRLFNKYGVYCCSEVTVAYRVHPQALTMEVFNEKTVSLLLDLFEEVDRLEILTKMEIERCKGLFFYQFILAGSIRQLKEGNFQKFKVIIKLLKLSKLKKLTIPVKWFPLKVFLVFLSYF